MNEIINTVITPGVVVLGCCIYLFGWGIKSLVEKMAPSLKKIGGELSWGPMFLSKVAVWWDVFSLHVLQVLLGVLVGAFLKSDFVFHGINDWGGRVLFGGAIGWFSGTIFKGVNKVLTMNLGADPSLQATTDPAPLATAKKI
jgi:hypothetical protein